MPKNAFSDLAARAVTGIAFALIALVAVWAGGGWFFLLVGIASGLMIWELARLTGVDGSGHEIALGVIAGLCLLAAWQVGWAFAALALPALAPMALSLAAGRRVMPDAAWLIGSLAVLLASYVALSLRDGGGVVWILWLILVVVFTDICGYFAGRTIGGAKFWPSISPNKTWAGVLAGWLAAGVVGAVFMPLTNTGEGLILVSIFLSFASQMGDIAESAIKRRAGVKDSSNLLPGHGGLLDRLDGVIGALLITGAVAALTNYPEAPI